MDVRILGAHNLETRHTRHTCLLIDGVLGLDMGSLASALTSAEHGMVRAVLLSHQHIDHIRDLPTLALSTLDDPTPIDVYSLPETLESARAHLLDGVVYPDFTQGLNDLPPKYRFQPVEPWKEFRVLGYDVKPVPVPHAVPALGFIVKSDSGGCVAYTGDIGGELQPFLRNARDAMFPQVVFVDVTFPNRLEWRAKVSGHLTPGMLHGELRAAMESGSGELPRIVAVHRDVGTADEVVAELSDVARDLGVDLAPGYEEDTVTAG